MHLLPLLLALHLFLLPLFLLFILATNSCKGVSSCASELIFNFTFKLTFHFALFPSYTASTSEGSLPVVQTCRSFTRRAIRLPSLKCNLIVQVTRTGDWRRSASDLDSSQPDHVLIIRMEQEKDREKNKEKK